MTEIQNEWERLQMALRAALQDGETQISISKLAGISPRAVWDYAWRNYPPKTIANLIALSKALAALERRNKRIKRAEG